MTGAGSGIGAATARRLRARGVRLVLVDREAGPVRRLAGRLDAVAVLGDVTDPEVNERAVRAATQHYGRLDLLHANAGRMTGPGPDTIDITAMTLDAYSATVGVNLDAVVHGIRAALPALRAGQGAAIVVTASLAGLTPYPPDPVYTMTKHAVVGLVRSLAGPLADSGVVVSAVCPGFVDTPLIAGMRAAFFADGFPLISADDAAAAVEHAWSAAEPGALWVVQPGREPIAYRPAGVPGPRAVTATRESR
ncbi:dehydrogenase [Amycolatopsis acidiphila]|nr:dehydrogenase [Amycolatopsis acidiphila]